MLFSAFGLEVAELGVVSHEAVVFEGQGCVDVSPMCISLLMSLFRKMYQREQSDNLRNTWLDQTTKNDIKANVRDAS